MRALRAALSCVVLAGCAAGPATEVLVVVRADAYVKHHATDLHVVVQGGTSAGALAPAPVFDRTFAKMETGAGESGWPHTVAVSPSGGDATRFYQVTATADLDGTPSTVQARVVSGYVRGHVLVLYLDLVESCAGVTCDAPMTTCRAGMCMSSFVDPHTLPDADGGVDGGPADGGGSDAGDAGELGSDQGADLGCTSNAQCDDHVFCNGAETCNGGVCTPGTAERCDDGVACTTDVCDGPMDACVNTPSDSLCTVGTGGHCDVSHGGCQYDTCDTTTCAPTPGACELASCMGTVCNRTPRCNPATEECCAGSCVPHGCDDSNPCTYDMCTSSGCVNTANSLPCSDGNVCTVGDQCSGGTCVTGSGTFPCDDGNPCTNDSCDAVAGCVTVYNTNMCDDGNPCTASDHCNGTGTCVGGGSTNCTDGLACTDDTCGAGGCVHTPNDSLCTMQPGGTCSLTMGCQYPMCDTSSCTSDPAMCIAASCMGSVCDRNTTCGTSQECCGGMCVPTGCNDGNPCTDDSCGVSGCVNTPNSMPCSDGNACTTGDFCSGGMCNSGTGTLNCDDGRPCTDDSCDTFSGCMYTYNTAPCPPSPPDFCHVGMCSAGSCTTSLRDCSDGDPCTTDSCDATGMRCVHSLVGGCDAGVPCVPPCDDGNICTSNVCMSGTCTYPPTPVMNPCCGTGFCGLGVCHLMDGGVNNTCSS